VIPTRAVDYRAPVTLQVRPANVVESCAVEVAKRREGAKGDIAIHGGSFENLGSLQFLVFGPVHMGDPPRLDLPERQPEGSTIT